MRFTFSLLCCATVAALISGPALAAAVTAAPSVALAPSFSLAMHGDAKYDAAMKSFDYVNPTAPRSDILHMGAAGTFDSLNPFIVRGNPPLGLVPGYMSMVYESLMTRSWDEPFTLYPLIAASVEVPDDRSSITFNLNPAAHFSDSHPLTTADVTFSYETLRDQGRPNHRTYYKKVLSVDVEGPHRLTFHFKPNADGSYDRELPLIMGLMPLLPKHAWAGRSFNETTLTPPIGSGPYRVDKVEAGRSIVYRRDPAYWGKDLPVRQGQFNFDQVRIDYFRDDAIALQAFKAGQIDLRQEQDPNKWSTAYESPALADGRMQRQAFAHNRTEPVKGFIFNTRRPLFQDATLRQALSAAFDFGWINQNLFHGLYKRTQSFFPNSELATKPTQLPDGPEREALEKIAHRDDLAATPLPLVTTDGTEASVRQALLSAADLLRKKGYNLKDGLLISPSGMAVRFEILLNDPAEEKVALQWTRALDRLGVKTTVHTTDSAQYQARLASFDYDVVIGKWTNSLSPGNEQATFWGCAASHQQGSRNYAGVCDKGVDALIRAIPSAASRNDLIAEVRALDRVLLSGFYVVPFYYLGSDLFAYQRGLMQPKATPLYGQVLETWWKQSR